MAEEKIEPKRVMVDGHEWSIYENASEDGSKISVLKRPDDTIARVVKYSSDGKPEIISVHGSLVAKPVMNVSILNGQVASFDNWFDNQWTTVVHEPEKNQVRVAKGRNQGLRVDLTKKHEVAVDFHGTVFRVARALHDFPGQEIGIPSPFDFKITRYGAKGIPERADIPNGKDGRVQLTLKQNGNCKSKHEMLDDGNHYLHLTQSGDMKLADFKLFMSPDHEIANFGIFYDGSRKNQYITNVNRGEDGAITIDEELRDLTGNITRATQKIPAEEYFSSSDLKSRIRAINGGAKKLSGAEKEELKQLELAQRLRQQALIKLNELLNLHDLSVDPKTFPNVQKLESKETVAPAAQAVPAAPPANIKTHTVTLGNKPWTVEEHFDDAGVRTKLLQIKPNGKPHREILYEGGRAALINLYQDNLSYTAGTLSFRENFDRPRLSLVDPKTGKIGQMATLVDPKTIQVSECDENGKMYGQTKTLSKTNPATTNEYDICSCGFAKFLMPLKGIDLGLPTYEDAAELDLYENGNPREMHIKCKNEGEYERLVYDYDGAIYSYVRINPHFVPPGSKTEFIAHQELNQSGTPVSRIIYNQDGTLNRFQTLRSPQRDGTQHPKLSFLFTAHDDPDQVINIERTDERGRVQHFRVGTKQIDLISHVAREKWGSEITLKDTNIKYEAAGLAPGALRFDTAPYAQQMARITELPPFEKTPEPEKAAETPSSAQQADAEWQPKTESAKFDIQAKKVAAKGSEPAYWQVRYCNKGETKTAKVEEYRTDGTLRMLHEKHERGGNVTYYWLGTKGSKPVERTKLRYDNTPFEDWNSHIMLSQVESSPISDEDKALIKERALDELGLMFEHHKQDIIIDLKHANQLDPAHIEAIKAIKDKVAEEAMGPAWESAKSKVLGEVDEHKRRILQDPVDHVETEKRLKENIRTMLPLLDEFEKTAQPSPKLMKRLRGLIREPDYIAVAASIADIKLQAGEANIDLSTLNLDALCEPVKVSETDPEAWLAKLRKEHLSAEADELKRAYDEALRAKPARKIFFSGVEGRETSAPAAGEERQNVNPSDALKAELSKAFPDVPVLPAFMNGRDPSADDLGMECITKHDEFDTKGRKTYSADFANGKIEMKDDRYQCREFDTSTARPKPDPKNKLIPRPIVLGDVQVGAGRALN